MTITLFRQSSCKIEFYQKTATIPFTFNDVVAIDTTGTLIRYAAAGAYPILGLVQKTVVSTDSDYGSTTRIPVLVCDENAEYLCDVSTGTAETSDIGEYIDFDDHNSVTVDSTNNDELYVTDILTGTNQVVAKFVRRLPRVFE